MPTETASIVIIISVVLRNDYLVHQYILFLHHNHHHHLHPIPNLELIALIALEIIVDGFLCDLLVVLLHGGEVLSGFAELALFHSLSDVPVHEGPLSVHEIEFVVHSAHYLGYGGGV